MAKPGPAEPPIIFLAFANPLAGAYLPRLVEEAAALRELCEAAERAGRCKLILRENATLDEVLDVFQDPDYHGRIAVFHFAGHGDSYGLLLENAARQPQVAHAGGLANFLAEQPNLHLVFLNACSTEEQVEGLHAAGVPAVIATTTEIQDDWALPFATRFYNGLLGGASIASAFRTAAAAMQAQLGAADAWPWQLHTVGDAGEWQLSDAQPVLAHPAAPWTVPFLQNKAFVGRDEDLLALHAALSTGSGSAATFVAIRPTGLTGLGGIGKTQLAVEYCYRYRDAYPDGVFWITAAGDWLTAFASLGVTLDPDLAGEPAVRQVRAAADYLRSHPASLLVLDNVEDPAQLTRPVTPDLIPAALPCRLLFTTRRRDVGSAHPIEVTVLPLTAGLQLLLRGAARQPAQDPQHPEHEQARAIYRMCGGLPLALEIAGAFLAECPEVTLAGYRQRLARDGVLATVDADAGDLPTGSLSGIHAAAVEATLAEQWRSMRPERPADADAALLLRIAGQLPEAAQIPAPRLGLLAGFPTLPQPGHPDYLARALRRLERLSLVEELRGDEVRLHPLVREFALRQTPDEQARAFKAACAEHLYAAYDNPAMLEQQCAHRGVGEVALDLGATLDLVAADRQSEELCNSLGQLLRMLQHEAHSLHEWNAAEQPAFFVQQWLKRLVIEGTPEQMAVARGALRSRSEASFEMRWSTAWQSAQLIYTLSGHLGPTSAVAVTPDGRKAVSASYDGTLKVWDLASGSELYTLSGHKAWIEAVVVTPDGRKAVSASGDGTLKVWDLMSGSRHSTFYGHTQAVWAVAVTSDGHRVVSASRDHTLKVWRLLNRREINTLRGHKGAVFAIAVTPDGRRVVSASFDDTLKVWDLESGRTHYTLQGHYGSVRAIAMTSDGRCVVWASGDGSLKVWDLGSERERYTLWGHTEAVNAIAVTPDGRKAVSGAEDGILKVWDLEGGRELHTIRGHSEIVLAIAVTPDGRRAVTASRDRTLKVWDLETGRETQTFRGHTDEVLAVAITPDGHRAVSASQDCTLKVWNLESTNQTQNPRGHTEEVLAIAVTPDGRRAVSASQDCTLKVWDLTKGGETHVLRGHTSSVYAVAVTPDGIKAISGSASADTTLKVWDLVRGSELYTLRGHTDWVECIVVTSDGRKALSASGDGTLKVWDLASGREVCTIKGHYYPVLAVAVTPEGHRMVSASEDGTLKVWDLDSGSEIHTLRGHYSPLRAVALTPEGDRVVSASDDHTLKVWDLNSGRQIHTLVGHTKEVRGVAVTPDGRRVVSASVDGTLKVWRLDSGRELHTLTGHTHPVRAVVMTPDGKRAVSASEDRSLKVWDLRNGHCLASISLESPLSCVALHGGNTLLAGDVTGDVHCLRLHLSGALPR